MSETFAKRHYLSQLYLKGFAEGESKKSTLHVFDLKGGRGDVTRPNKAAGWAGTELIGDAGGGDPSALTGALEALKADSDKTLEEIGRTRKLPQGQARDVLLNLAAVYLTAHRGLRGVALDMHDGRERIAAELMVNTPPRPGAKLPDDGLSVQDLHRIVQPWVQHDIFDVDVASANRLPQAPPIFEAVLAALLTRQWFLIDAEKADGAFIVSDWPVAISWQSPDAAPHQCASRPGLALRATDVSLPLRRDLALIGRFEAPPKKPVKPEPHVIGAINSRTALFAERYLFGPRAVTTAPGMEVIAR